MQSPLAKPARRAVFLVNSLTMLFATLLATLVAVPAHAAQSSVAAIIEDSSPALVHISVLFDRADAAPDAEDRAVRVARPSSGVIVSSSGLVLTAAHLVAEVEDGILEDEFWIEATTQEGATYNAIVVARDERTDLALLQLQLEDGQQVPAVPLAPAQALAPGSRVVAISFHDGEHAYAYQGAAAQPAGEVQVGSELLRPEEALITDARFHRLLDGAPVLDARGALVGVYNATHVLAASQRQDEDTPEEELGADYAVAVTASAIHASFGDKLAGVETVKAPEPESETRAIAAIAPSVVSVWGRPDKDHPASPAADDPHAQRIHKALGSGVILSPGGLVVTSADLFHGRHKQKASVRLADGTLYSASVLRVEHSTQLAMLQLDLPAGTTVLAAQIGDSLAARSGETVSIAARPFGPALTLSVGVLGNLDRGSDGFFQIASWVHRGHWGGAVVDNNGRLIGVVIERATGQGRKIDEESYLGFAAPTDRILAWFAKEWEAHSDDATRAAVRPDTPGQLAGRETAITDVVDAVQGSLVNILVSQAIERESTGGFDPFATEEEPIYMGLGQGSGVIIDSSGLALSNWHVVDAAVDRSGEQMDGFRITVTLPDGRDYVARVLSTSRDDDLSLLRLELAEGEELVPVEMADSEALLLGQRVIAIGNSLGLSDSVSSGVISCKSSDEGIKGRLRKYKGMLTTDASINPGNSGGALLDLQGRLVGINSAGGFGRGLAIPVNRAREVFSDKLLSAQKLRSVYLGLHVGVVNGRMEVIEVDIDSPAARAGVEEGDAIASLGDQPVEDLIGWAQLLLHTSAAQPVGLVVVREGKHETLSVQPLTYAVRQLQRKSGLEVAVIDYDQEFDLLRDASVALHRAYTEDPTAEPTRIMPGALRVVRSYSVDPHLDCPVRAGDVLLGMTRLVYDTTDPRRELVKLTGLDEFAAMLTEMATKKGALTECWLWRDGKVITVDLMVRRPY